MLQDPIQPQPPKPEALFINVVMSREEADALRWMYSMYYQLLRMNFLPIIQNPEFPRVAPILDQEYMRFMDTYHDLGWCKNPFCGNRKHEL